MFLSDMTPYVNERMPEIKLTGKQIKPVKGSGSMVAHKVRTVNIPRIKLMMECLLVGGMGTNSIGSIRYGGF